MFLCPKLPSVVATDQDAIDSTPDKAQQSLSRLLRVTLKMCFYFFNCVFQIVSHGSGYF